MAKIPNYISEIIPYSRVLKKKNGFRSSIGGYIARSKFLIANEFGVDPDKVHDIFLKAWDKSEKDYPSPSIIFPQNSKEADLYNNYVLYIWKYYVEDKSKPKPPPKEPKLPDIKQPDIEEEEEQEVDPDNPYAGDDEPSMLQEMGRVKPEKSGGLTIVEKTYEGTRGTDLVDEEIDERILKLLGLEDIFDLDYDTYASLLRGWAIEARMKGTSVSTEESELVTEEFKRVKRKVGRFKINKKKTDRGGVPPLKSAKNFITGATEPPQKLLPPAGAQKPKRKATLEENIAAIRKSLESILKLMENQFSMLRKQIETDRRARERSRRDERENRLEAGIKKTMALAKKVLAPALSLLDRIINFITTVLLGRALIKLMDWLANPDNQKKLDSLLRFVGDWWPSILAAWVLFATPLGKLIRTVLGGITKLTMFMARKGIPKLLGIIRKNPYAAAALAAGVGAGIAATQLGGNREKLAKDDPNIVKPGDNKTPSGSQLRNEEVMQRGIPAFASGGRISRYSKGGKMLPSRRTQNSSAGKITGSTGRRIRGAGKDTQLVAAQPGEVVISKKAVDKFGAPFFLNLNKMGGGTNMPTYSKFSDIQFAQGGGQIGVNIDDGLDKLDVSQLSRMLDPTEPGARRPHVFRAASEARQRYASAPREERERQALIATIRAVRSPESTSSSRSTISTASRPQSYSGSSVSNKIIPRSPVKPNLVQTKGEGQDEGGEITSKNIVTGSGTSAPFSGVLPKPDTKPAAMKPTRATVASGVTRQLEAPSAPEPSVNVMTLSASEEQKMLGTGSQSSGTRGHDVAFDAFIQTDTRMNMMAIYGITGVA